MTRKTTPFDAEMAHDDPELDRLLDAALAAGSAPPAMVERIVARTTPELRRPGGIAVLARIGWPALRVAAAVAIVSVVAWSLINAPADQWNPPAPGSIAASMSLDELGRRLAAVSDAANEQEPAFIDQRIDLLAMQIDVVQAGSVWQLDDDTVEETLLLHEIDQYLNEMTVLF